MEAQQGTRAVENSARHIPIETLVDTVMRLGRDPLAEWMKEQGFDPTQGGCLLWPRSVYQDWGVMGPPSYVMLTDLVQNPVLINTQELCRPNMTWQTGQGTCGG